MSPCEARAAHEAERCFGPYNTEERTPMSNASHSTSTSNQTLFNCCAGALPPDWALFDAVEVNPVRIDPDGQAECLSYDERHEATVWTVYGHCVAGGVDALTDVTTERLAMGIARKFEDILRERGLLVYPMFDEVRS
jgi:hypothetical protein